MGSKAGKTATHVNFASIPGRSRLGLNSRQVQTGPQFIAPPSCVSFPLCGVCGLRGFTPSPLHPGFAGCGASPLHPGVAGFNPSPLHPGAAGLHPFTGGCGLHPFTRGLRASPLHPFTRGFAGLRAAGLHPFTEASGLHAPKSVSSRVQGLVEATPATSLRFEGKARYVKLCALECCVCWLPAA